MVTAAVFDHSLLYTLAGSIRFHTWHAVAHWLRLTVWWSTRLLLIIAAVDVCTS